MTAPKLPPRLSATLSEEINVAAEAWLWLKTNLAHLTGAMAVLVIGVIVGVAITVTVLLIGTNAA